MSIRKAAIVKRVPPEVANAWIEVAIADAAVHGQESEPDMEVGDLQQLVRALAAEMSTEQIMRVARAWTPWRES